MFGFCIRGKKGRPAIARDGLISLRKTLLTQSLAKPEAGSCHKAEPSHRGRVTVVTSRDDGVCASGCRLGINHAVTKQGCILAISGGVGLG